MFWFVTLVYCCLVHAGEDGARVFTMSA